ncbi:MAG: UDP-N-acetylglucosamine 1-carboxyvinyltransferase [Fidelibacterota bacterium]
MMDKLVIHGQKKLDGIIPISGAKNAVLPVMVATLLAPGEYRISKVPDLRDTRTMLRLLKLIGVSGKFENNELYIDTRQASNPEAPYDLVKTMRASFYVLGPLTARFGHAKVSLPGGCAWGPRPVNFHLSSLKAMGADIQLDEGYVITNTDRLQGAEITFDFPSVGATGNAVMAAVLAEGRSVIRNAAREPEIACLCHFLQAMGANIVGTGSATLSIEGMEKLHPADFEVIPDRIEAATFLIAGAMVGDRVTVKGVNPDHLTTIFEKLRLSGQEITVDDDQVTVRKIGSIIPVDVSTAVYPGFPTDVQAQWMALMSIAEGTSIITDTVYHDRFTHVAELGRLGARVSLTDNVAVVAGRKVLKGAPVMSTDIRASASLILAGLAANGRTDISRVYHIDRGYERIEEKLKGLGADIRRESE